MHRSASRLALWYGPSVRVSEAAAFSVRCRRYYMFYGVALCVSGIAIFKKANLLIYKLRKRRSCFAPSVRVLSAEHVEERLDINKQEVTKALLYLLVAAFEVRRAAACTSHEQPPIHAGAGLLPLHRPAPQDIPSSVLTTLYILEAGAPPSTIVVLSFATSLIYLGSAWLVLSASLTLGREPRAEALAFVHTALERRNDPRAPCEA